MIHVSKNTSYLTNGVTVTPATPTSGDNIKIVYDGLLSKSGATNLVARVGFDEKWKNTNDYAMTRTPTGFEASLHVPNAKTLNVCFRDIADNWDNNNGRNYSFEII